MKTSHQYVPITRKDGSQNLGNKYRALKDTRLKEVYIVRYADDFKLFCRNHNDAVKIFEATKKWLKERLKLEISTEKSKIVNLKKNYSDFLGIKMKVTNKNKGQESKEKYVIKSHIGNKAFEKIMTTIRKYTVKLQKSNVDTRNGIIYAYNSYVLGIHNYFNIATHCNLDFSKIAFRTRATLKNRLRKNLRKKKQDDKIPKYMEKFYGKSNQIRFVYNIAIVPLGYIQHQWARQFKGYSPYVSKDRSSIHSEQRAVDFKILKSIMENPIKGQSVEYNDNRISLFVGQYGKCYVTSKEMNSQNMHCHHKLPKNLGGTDEYKNLVLIEENIHRLVHAVKEETIKRYLSELNLTSEMIDKINKLRGKAKLQKISL